ncbi:MAG: hypothetical protein BWX58_01197 [Deltaproteobacteria bacterium ADurb.Bin026]|nr:MAG: hypothetical protein BWX58_01197 [Deltaproteobacteria bacterium ADurb.Bin026]
MSDWMYESIEFSLGSMKRWKSSYSRDMIVSKNSRPSFPIEASKGLPVSKCALSENLILCFSVTISPQYSLVGFIKKKCTSMRFESAWMTKK